MNEIGQTALFKEENIFVLLILFQYAAGLRRPAAKHSLRFTGSTAVVLLLVVQKLLKIVNRNVRHRTFPTHKLLKPVVLVGNILHNKHAVLLAVPPLAGVAYRQVSSSGGGQPYLIVKIRKRGKQLGKHYPFPAEQLACRLVVPYDKVAVTGAYNAGRGQIYHRLRQHAQSFSQRRCVFPCGAVFADDRKGANRRHKHGAYKYAGHGGHNVRIGADKSLHADQQYSRNGTEQQLGKPEGHILLVLHSASFQ